MRNNAYQEQRREELGRLLDASMTGEAADYGEHLELLCEYVEREIDGAFKRGLSVSTRNVAEPERARRTSNGKRLVYRSAVQGGVLKRAEG